MPIDPNNPPYDVLRELLRAAFEPRTLPRKFFPEGGVFADLAQIDELPSFTRATIGSGCFWLTKHPRSKRRSWRQ